MYTSVGSLITLLSLIMALCRWTAGHIIGLGSDGDVSAGVPDLWGLLAVPTPAEGVLSSFELWNLQLVNHLELHVLRRLRRVALRPSCWELKSGWAERRVVTLWFVALGVWLEHATAIGVSFSTLVRRTRLRTRLATWHTELVLSHGHLLEARAAFLTVVRALAATLHACVVARRGALVLGDSSTLL